MSTNQEHIATEAYIVPGKQRVKLQNCIAFHFTEYGC